MAGRRNQTLKPRWFQILLALSDQNRHGSGIVREVLAQTDGELRLWPAMLYRSLGTLEKEGLIRQATTPINEPEDERRQYYALTPAGRLRLEEEATMMARWADAARRSEPA